MASEGIVGTSRYGQTAKAGAEEAQFLKVYAGEVLTAFERETVTSGRVNTRTITSGKSAQFPLVGAMSASYHVPGENVIQEGGTSPTYLSQPTWNEKVIAIDGILQSSVMINDIDDFMTHYEVRGPYAREMGWALAKEFDVHVLQTIIAGAEDSATISGDASDWGASEDKSIADTDFTSGTASNALSTIQTIAASMDANDVPRNGRHIAVEPALYYKFLNEEKVVSADYNAQTMASGTGGRPPALQYLGMQIHPTNRLADIRALGSSGQFSLHSEQHGTDFSSNNFDHVLAVAWQEDWAVGVVRLKELGMQSEYLLQYLGTLMLAGFSVGHGVLHESACFFVHNEP
jgi:hypothetical protein